MPTTTTCRKIIRRGGQGPNGSLLITLPRSWCRMYGVGKGGSVTVTEDGDMLVVRLDHHTTAQTEDAATVATEEGG